MRQGFRSDWEVAFGPVQCGYVDSIKIAASQSNGSASKMSVCRVGLNN